MRRALIIDDDRKIRNLVEGFLASSLEMDVASADDGAEAIRKLRAEDFSLILLDLMMPGLSGFAVLEYMQSDKPHLLDRVIVMTGRKIGSQPRIVKMDFTGRLLHKPFTERELREKVLRILGSG